MSSPKVPAPNLRFVMGSQLPNPRVFEAEALVKKSSGHAERFTIHQWFQINRVCPDSIIYCLDERDRVAGVLIQLQVSPEYLTRTLEADFSETETDLSQATQPGTGRQYNIHIPTMSIDESHVHRVHIMTGLASKFVEYHKGRVIMNSKLIKISAISDNLWTDYFYRLIGMDSKGANSRSARVMLCSNFSSFIYRKHSTDSEKKWIVHNILRNVSKI